MTNIERVPKDFLLLFEKITSFNTWKFFLILSMLKKICLHSVVLQITRDSLPYKIRFIRNILHKKNFLIYRKSKDRIIE